ncbi:hypothetical protein SAMN05444280_103151 [Tangfeifania diversioriginum]|uniref:Uncharacterized protein n=1 Tax=Tangfeifania diversioriginum TaxID=1168035 RepID=A0A1M6C617_9BACT|nr:hypothetical protein SAMN05444280_103151 [Tangfeifania diversioriginum]
MVLKLIKTNIAYEMKILSRLQISLSYYFI